MFPVIFFTLKWTSEISRTVSFATIKCSIYIKTPYLKIITTDLFSRTEKNQNKQILQL